MVILIPLSQFGEDDDDLLEHDGVEDADEKRAAHWDWNVMFIVQLREAAGRPTKHLTQL